jgi:DNA-directed RNA polymerase specialized sigma24 family protein
LQRQKKDWQLSQPALDKLLIYLDSDREAAGQKYEAIRSKLIKFFEWRGCISSQEYADLTLDRVATRLLDGVELSPKNPYLYFHGVALNLLREYWRDPERQMKHSELEEFVAPNVTETDPQSDRISDCMDRCLLILPPESRHLLEEYHQPGGKNKQRRKKLAALLSIPMNALRIRAFRLRVQLQKCVEKCTTSL